MFAFVVIAAASSSDEALWSTPETTPSEPVAPDAPVDSVAPAPPPSTDASGDWLSAAGPVLQVIGVLLFATVVVLGVLVVLRGTAGWSWASPFRRGRTRRTSVMAPLPQIARTVEADDEAMLATLREGPPRNGIVRCWMALEASAAAAGMRRAPAETSSEYVERVIAASSVDPQPIADLGTLFREARFSSRPVDEARRAQAEDALRRTLAGLDRGVGVGA